MSRKLRDWIGSYLEFVEVNSESPRSFHEWTAIGTISAALQRKVYMQWGHTTIFPNEYICLVGPSGTSRKGEPISILTEFARELGMPMVGEDNSQESIIRDMKNAVTSFKDNTTGDTKFQCAMCAFAEELSVFTGYQNGTLLAYLTNWYDSRDRWTRRTKHQGHDEILGLCFTLVASTAPDWLPHILPKEAIGGGFTSRILFVSEDESGKIVALPEPEDLELKAALMHDLEYIHTISGEMRFTNKAKHAYVEWYEGEGKLMKNGGRPELRNPMLSGYVGRRATHIKKLCMALAVSRANTLQIREEDFLRARGLMESVEKKMASVYRGLGKSRYSEETENVLIVLRRKHKLRRSELLKELYPKLDSEIFDKVAATLMAMRSVKVTRPRKHPEDLIFELTE